jgi:hypothetical protein
VAPYSAHATRIATAASKVATTARIIARIREWDAVAAGAAAGETREEGPTGGGAKARPRLPLKRPRAAPGAPPRPLARIARDASMRPELRNRGEPVRVGLDAVQIVEDDRFGRP